MVAEFLDHNNGNLTNDAGDVEENWKKAIALYPKTTTVHLRHAFLYAF